MLSRMALMSWADLSFVLPVTSLGYVLSAAMGQLFLAEHVSPQRWSGTILIVAGTALVSGLARSVHAGEDNTIRVALVGCGGRGTGATANALAVKSTPMKLVAMADVFAEKLNRSYDALNRAALAVLAPGGLLVLCVPNMAGILGRMDPLVSNIPPHHVSRWTPTALGFLKNHFPVELIALRYEPAYNFLRPYLKERLEHQGVPEWGVKLIWRLGLSLPLKLLRHLKPAGLQSLPGHTVYALYRKQVY